jgi:arsenate reductase
MNYYHNPRCGTSRKALEILSKKKIKPTIIDYQKEPLNQKELAVLIKSLGIKAESLVRKKEPLFKEKFAGKSFTQRQWIKILAENPKLIERPIFEANGKAVIGRPPEKVLEIL